MITNTTITPVLTLLRGGRVEGELPLVTKGPIDHLAEEDLETIRLAEFTHQLGKEDEAKAMIAALEQKLGITPADKAAAFGPQEPWEGDLLEALGLAPDADPPPVLTGDFRRFNEAETALIDRHDHVRRIAKVRGNRKTVSQAEGKLADVARARNHRVDLQERRDGIKETVQLAKDRGEEVENDRAGIKILTRDGFRHLRQLKHLTDAQYAVGLLYRSGFEARSADLKAQVVTEGGGGGGHDNNQYVADRFDRAKLLHFVARVDRAVAVAHPGAPQALQMLRWVAGEGHSLGAFGHGRAFERNRKGLTDALDVAISVARMKEGSAR